MLVDTINSTNIYRRGIGSSSLRLCQSDGVHPVADVLRGTQGPHPTAGTPPSNPHCAPHGAG